MTNTATTLQPVERQDIHKSCRTIETLLSALNDYSEAATAFAAIQKKLSKALRDTVGLKTNAQFAGECILGVACGPQPRTIALSANAFGASFNILEVLVDVNSKFAKLAERESRSIGSEFKKWLKKLAVRSLPHIESSTKVLSRETKKHTTSA